MRNMLAVTAKRHSSCLAGKVNGERKLLPHGLRVLQVLLDHEQFYTRRFLIIAMDVTARLRVLLNAFL